MDLRKGAAALLFTALGLLSLASLKTVQATQGDCSNRNAILRKVTYNDLAVQNLYCSSTNWTIGSDLCNASSFVPYIRCTGLFQWCNIDRSDYLHRGHTYVCCGGGSCFDIIIQPVLLRSVVPPVIQAGKEETIYMTITAKPLPSKLPSLTLQLVRAEANESNITEVDTYPRVIENAQNSTEYFILHTFTVPPNVDAVERVRLRFELPDDFEHTLDGLAHDGIAVYPGEEVQTTTTDREMLLTTTSGDILTTTDNITNATSVMGEEITESTCIDPGALAGATVGGVGLSAVICIVFACIFCWYKKHHKEKINGGKKEASETYRVRYSNGYPAHVPSSLPISRDTNISKAPSTTPTPYGESEDTQLLPHHKNHAALHVSTDSPGLLGAHNPGYGRLQSTSPTTPSDTLRPPLSRESSNAASAASPATIRVVEEPGTGLGLTVNAGADSNTGDGDVATVEDISVDDQEQLQQHIYDVVKRPLPETPDARQQNAPPPAAALSHVHTHSAAAALSISTCAHCHNCNILLLDARGQQGPYPTSPLSCTSCGHSPPSQLQKNPCPAYPGMVSTSPEDEPVSSVYAEDYSWGVHDGDMVILSPEPNKTSFIQIH